MLHYSYPFDDPCVVLLVTGKSIQDALENAVSLYPALEGCFPQVSNITFDFDPSRPPNSRLGSIRIGGQALNQTASYRLATRDYMARGKDGYTSLLASSAGGVAKEIIPAADGLRIHEILLRYFASPEVFLENLPATLDANRETKPSVLTSFTGTTIPPASLCSASISSTCSPSSSLQNSPRPTLSSVSSVSSEAFSSSTPLTPPCSHSSETNVYENSFERSLKDESLNLPWIAPRVEGRIRIVGGN